MPRSLIRGSLPETSSVTHTLSAPAAAPPGRPCSGSREAIAPLEASMIPTKFAGTRLSPPGPANRLKATAPRTATASRALKPGLAGRAFLEGACGSGGSGLSGAISTMRTGSASPLRRTARRVTKRRPSTRRARLTTVSLARIWPGSAISAQPCRQVECPAAVSPFDGHGFPGVEAADAHSQREGRARLGRRSKAGLELDGRQQSAARRSEHGQGFVAAQLQLPAEVGHSGIGDLCELRREYPGGFVPVLLSEARVSAHLRYQEGAHIGSPLLHSQLLFVVQAPAYCGVG